MKLELLRDTLGLCNRYHVESKFLKDTMVSESIGFRQHLSVDGLMPKSEVFGLFCMSYCYICEFPETFTPHQLAKHKNQQMVPVGHCPSFGSIIIFDYDAVELPL